MRVRTVRKFNGIYTIFVFALITIVAIIFLVLSFTILNKKIPENYVETEATIVDIEPHTVFDDTEYTVYIDYSFGGKNYTHVELNKYDSSMEVGNKVKIFVNPDNPTKFENDKKGDFIFPLLSGVFAVVGIVGLVINIKRTVELKRSKQ